MKKYIIIITVLFSIVWNYESGICRSWDDLDEGEHEIYGSEREAKFPVKALFMEKEQWENHYSLMLFGFYKHTDYPKYKSTRFLPFYYGLDSKIDNRTMTVLPPLLSYFETDGTGDTSYILFPLYYSSTDTNEYDKSLLFLIWWGKEQNEYSRDSYQTIFPVLYHSSDVNTQSGSGEYLWINPLFVSWRDKISDTEEKEHMWWAPIIPLTYHHVDRYSGHRNILWLMDYSWNIIDGKDQMERFWLFPLYLWEGGDNGYTTVLPPVYVNNRHSNGDYYYHLLPLFATWMENSSGYTWKEFATLLFSSYSVTNNSTGEEAYSNFWFPIIPLFYHSSEANLQTGGGEYLWINPLFVSWRDKISPTEEREHLWWAPIIPLTFSYVDKNSGHRNFLWLMDYSWNIIDGKDQMERFWLLPLYLWERGDNGYTAVLPPLYIDNRYNNGDYYCHLFPAFISWKENISGYTWKEFATLLFSSYSVTENKTGEETYSSCWFPIIPLFFRSSDREEGTHINIAWFIDWESRKDGSLKSVSIAPFIFHQTGEGGYKYWIPVYCRPSGATDKEGYTFGLFHYYSWSESGSTVWSWLYYSSNEFVDKPAVKESKLPAVKGRTRTGVEESKDLLEKEEFYYTHFLPLYWSWKSTESTGRIVLPLYFNYKDKQTDIHVNLAGLAIKTYMGPFNPDVSVGLTKKDDIWYFDSDYSWLYDVVSVSTRVPIRNPFTEKNDNKDEENKYKALENVNATTGIVGKKEMNRENSTNFWGWDLLFGWMAYEKADSRKHFRVIPLAWFTWDEKADDKLYVFLPFFFSYASQETREEYFVLAPLYASQRQDKSYTKAYLINLYWDQYTAETDCYEKTVLWPIINWYSSPERNGFRIIPIVLHREWKEGGDESSQTFTPLYYSKDVKKTGSGEYKLRSRVNPLYYLGEANDGKNSSYSLFVPLIPLFYHTSESNGITTSDTTVTPLFVYNSEDIKQSSGVNRSSTYWFPLIPLVYHTGELNDIISSGTTVTLLYVYNSEDRKQGGGLNSSSTFWFPLIPLVYHSSESNNTASSSTTVTPLYVYDNEETKQGGGLNSSSTFWSPLIPVFYRNSSGEYSHWNLLGILDRCSDKNYGRFFLFPLYYSTEEDGEKHKNIIGIIDWWSGPEGVDTSMVIPLYWWSGDKNSSTLILFPLISYFNTEGYEKTRFVAGAYWYESPSYERQNFLFLFDHEKFISDSYPRDEYSLLFRIVELDIAPEIKEMRILWGSLLDYKNYRNSKDYDIDAVLWLAGIERNGDYFHHRVLPFYWYSSEKDETSLLIPPILSYFSKDKNGDFDLGVLGLVYYRNEDRSAGEDRRMWLLGTLYNEVKVPERKYHARGSLWGFLWDYETEEETDFSKFTILKGLYKYIENNGKTEHTVLWVF